MGEELGVQVRRDRACYPGLVFLDARSAGSVEHATQAPAGNDLRSVGSHLAGEDDHRVPAPIGGEKYALADNALPDCLVSFVEEECKYREKGSVVDIADSRKGIHARVEALFLQERVGPLGVKAQDPFKKLLQRGLGHSAEGGVQDEIVGGQERLIRLFA